MQYLQTNVVKNDFGEMLVVWVVIEFSCYSIF